MYALLFFFCLTGQSGPSACGHVANNNNNNIQLHLMEGQGIINKLLFTLAKMDDCFPTFW